MSREHSLKISAKIFLSYKISKFVMAYPFLKELSACDRLKCLMTYAVEELCITTMVSALIIQLNTSSALYIQSLSFRIF